MQDALVIAGREFGSRLFLGTGKFPSNASLEAAIVSSGTEMVTVALRRIDVSPGAAGDILDAVDPARVLLLTNTSGADDAAVLVTTAIGTAGDPAAMGDACRMAVVAGRQAFLAGLAAVGRAAEASSPLTGFLS